MHSILGLILPEFLFRSKNHPTSRVRARCWGRTRLCWPGWGWVSTPGSGISSPCSSSPPSRRGRVCAASQSTSPATDATRLDTPGQDLIFLATVFCWPGIIWSSLKRWKSWISAKSKREVRGFIASAVQSQYCFMVWWLSGRLWCWPLHSTFTQLLKRF